MERAAIKSTLWMALYRKPALPLVLVYEIISREKLAL